MKRSIMIDTSPCFAWFLITISIGLLTSPGCGKGTVTSSVTGVVTNIGAMSRNNELELTFKDGTEMELKNGHRHPIFKNTPIRIDYDSGRCILKVTRLAPVTENDTVINIVGEGNSDTNSFNRPLIIQMNDRPEGTWGIGSTMQEVIAIEGEPHRVTTYASIKEIRWRYGTSKLNYVEFKLMGNTMRVSSYDNDLMGDKDKFQFKASAIPVRIIKEKN